MAAKDVFHDVVKAALERDGWVITDDPLTIRVDSLTDLFIDLGAEKLIAAEKENQKIAIEIKSFLGQSVVSEFHTAIGQFTNYRYALSDREPERVLYLAVPASIYDEFFTRPFIQSVIQRSRISLLIYNIETGEIVRWQKQSSTET
ncbi:XisH family protein [Egbenema bharatensis]|uniref:XisH family protein n=1 Tax=Egbenema bharatensis TaxID=3463334 RepID=UPI003A86D7DE